MTERHAVNFRELMDRIRSYTLREFDLEREDWQKAVFVEALWVDGKPAARDLAAKLIARVVETQTSRGEFAYGGMDRNHQLVGEAGAIHWARVGDDRFVPNTSTARLAMNVLDLHEATGEACYLEAASQQLKALLACPRTKDGAIWQFRRMPYLLIDGVYMICPFIARMGHWEGERLFEEALHQLRTYVGHLRDERTGLFRHVWCERPDHYPQSHFWGRANAWVLGTCVELLEILPENHPGRSEAEALLSSFLKALTPLQDRSGFWHNVLDDPDAYLETSVTALIAAWLLRGIRLGHVPDSYRSVVERALRVLPGTAQATGAVGGPAAVPGGAEAPPRVTLIGQASLLLTLAEATRAQTGVDES